MRRLVLVLTFALLATGPTARAQFRNRASVEKLNRRLQGQVLDYTHNHGADRRIYSAILGMPRDLYVYLPPGYDPSRAYPLVLYFHMAYIDEHTFVGSDRLVELDGMMARGEFPPAVVACPDGMIGGENRYRQPHSMYVNGVHGRFEDHVLYEVMPFLSGHFSIRPERGAHALLGASAGGFGAASIALRHRELFGAVAVLATPMNMRYWNCLDEYFADFDPSTYRAREDYDPDQVVGRFYFGLQRTRARKYIEPIFGSDPGVNERIAQVNPADQISRAGLRPGELEIYINCGDHDNFNFDAQSESFAWLAGQAGVCVTLEEVPCGRHSLRYFRENHLPAYRWLAGRLLPPVELAAPACRGPAG
jgi:S-formylglutathione hydrolase FrmB